MQYATFSLKATVRYGFFFVKDLEGRVTICGGIHSKPSFDLYVWNDKVTFPITANLMNSNSSGRTKCDFTLKSKNTETAIGRREIMDELAEYLAKTYPEPVLIPHAPLWDDFLPSIKAA